MTQHRSQRELANFVAGLAGNRKIGSFRTKKGDLVFANQPLSWISGRGQNAPQRLSPFCRGIGSIWLLSQSLEGCIDF